MSKSEFMDITDEVIAEELEIIEEFIKEEVEPLIKYKKEEEKKAFDKLYKEVLKLEEEV